MPLPAFYFQHFRWVKHQIVNRIVSGMTDSSAGTNALPEGVADSALPTGTRQATSDWGRAGYRGPCPPIGRHRYFFKLYALDTVLPDLGQASKAQLEQAMNGHVLGKAELIGTYQKGQP